MSPAHGHGTTRLALFACSGALVFAAAMGTTAAGQTPAVSHTVGRRRVQPHSARSSTPTASPATTRG